ncbi:integrase [Burkholderia thailandensis]|uniref:integrase n=1 Tax=Burkholderia thailandensis TaxID=57975 RepID=UPI000ACCF345|nr:integrase [Burkholderia thailandensis]
MMEARVLHFTPRAELEPHANLAAFIDLCRQSEVLNARQQFDLNVWDCGYLKGHNTVHRAVFSTLEAAFADATEPCLPQPFLNFAKAMLVYMHDTNPVVSQNVRIAAIRCLEASLREWHKGSRPTAVNVDVLDTAVDLARKNRSAMGAYHVAGQIKKIADLMNSLGFIGLRKEWVHGLRKGTDLGTRISKDALKARQEKLPSAAALRALAGIFREATAPVDVMVSSYTALLVCAPDRINEALRLSRSCLVDGDGEFRGKLGVRWAGSKGFPDSTKWLPSEMAPVAREAIASLVKATADAREIAKWYTANPGALYLHKAATELGKKEVLTSSELALALWADESAYHSASHWANSTAKLNSVSLGGNRLGYRFVDVERAVLSMLPKTFPYVPGAPELLCENALAITRTNELHAQRATWCCMFACVDYTSITRRLSAGDDRETIFERFGYTEDDGSPIVLRSHSLRHYLNMLANMGGMSSTEIAIFSGRKDVKQNRAYDHMSSDEVQAPISEALKTGFTDNLVVPEARDLIVRSDFQRKGVVAAHTTDYGWCMHDFASEPCPVHRDCINCEEQECVKGEAHKEANLRQLKSETEYLLKAAREALNDEEYGADIWVKHQTQTLERVDVLLSVLEDPQVAPGARIRLKVTNAPLVTADGVPRGKVIETTGPEALE